MLDEHGEEQDEKTKRNLEILKNYKKKEIKNVKYIFLTIFLDIRKLLKSCVCDTLGLVSRKEFEAQKEIIEKLNREINKIKSVKRKV